MILNVVCFFSPENLQLGGCIGASYTSNNSLTLYAFSTSTVCVLFPSFLPILCFYTCASMYTVFIENIDEYSRSCIVAIAFLVSLILLII